jgi:anaerobic selenocysteine-containing dehydrogenase
MSELTGSTQWKSLESLHSIERDPFTEFIRREYPSQAHRLADPPERREFLKLMGASLALAGVGVGCTRQPKEEILPYAKSPESTIPGKPRYFATSMPWPTGAIGILVESHEGRPTKIEGNPDHPASLGATDAITQASILGLYDPDRAKTIDYRGRIRTWEGFLVALKTAMNAQAAKQGAGLRILTGAPMSPTLEAQIADLLAKYPKVKRHFWEPAMSRLALETLCSAELLRFDAADVVVSFGADFLGAGPGCARTTRDFMARRRNGEGGPNRLYVVETAVSLTGACADERLPRRPSEIVAIARALVDRIRRGKSFTPPITETDAWIEAVARDLEAHPKRSMVVADKTLSVEVQRAARDINLALGKLETNTTYQATPTLPAAAEARKNIRHPWLDLPSLEELTASLRDGTTDLLVILGGNPVYDAPADLDFAGALARVPMRVHLSIEGNETTDLCDWHVNGTHFLESWSDALSGDGSVGIVQPLIAPLYDGKSPRSRTTA